jgi:outer membrane protein assembly factor BamB
VKKSNKKNYAKSKVKTKSLTVLLVSVFLLSALAGTQFIGEVSAIDYTEIVGTLDGADYALRIPDPWNGMLVVICRGYSPTLPSPLSPINNFGSSMLEQGFAVAASNFGAAGHCILTGVNSTYELTIHIINTYHVTGKVFLFGISMGGAVALLLGEKYPDIYSGVLDLFGVKDLKDSYTVKTRWANLTDEELTAELTALTAPAPPFMFPTLQAFRDFLASSAASIELDTGGTPATQPTAYEDRSPTYHADIMIPVITVHGTSDALVPFYQSIMYQTAVANAGHSNLYRLYNVTGGQHASSDVIAEVPARFNELVEWSNELTGSSDWPMYRHDLQHTGYSTSNAPNTNQTLWTNTIFALSSPAVVDGKVYLGSFDGTVHCLDAATGAKIWNYTTGDGIFSSPAVAGGRVYVGSADDNVYCLDAATGAKIWSYKTGGDVWDSPAVYGGKVYVGSYDDRLYCLRTDTGAVEWTFTTGDDVGASSPAVAYGRVYVGSIDDKVYCLDATSGALVWSYTTGDDVQQTPAVANGRVYVGSADRNLRCLNASTGALIWNYTAGDIAHNPAVAGGNVYVGSSDDNAYCFDALTGALIWNYTTGGAVISPPAVADGKVYVGSLDGKLYCLNAETGALIWSYTTASTLFYSSPAVANGVVYITSGNVYAFSPWAPIPEGLTLGVMLLLSTVAVIVSIHYFRKRPKIKNLNQVKP